MVINVFVILLLFTTSYIKPANSDENVGGWLDFQLLMKKKDAEPLIRKMCAIVDDRGRDLEGEYCSVKQGWFKGKTISLSLLGSGGFFSASNAQVFSIIIRTDYDQNFFNYLENNLANRWNISQSYECTKPRSEGYKKCGMSFNNRHIRLSHWYSPRYGGISSMSLSYSTTNIGIFLG